MKLYIPEIGDHLRLTEDWTFNLYNEYRNASLWKLYDCDNQPEVILQKSKEEALRQEIADLQAKMFPGNTYWNRNHVRTPQDVADEEMLCELQAQRRSLDLHVVSVSIPKDSVLSVDRIFIRKGLEGWSSLTFYLKHHPEFTLKKKPRFWVKLGDCNNIAFEKVNT